MQRNWRSLVAALAVVGLLAVAGCGSVPQPAGSASGGDTAAPTAAPATSGSTGTGQAAAPAAATQPAPKQGPVRLVVGAHQDIRHWDIHNHNYTFTEAVHQNVFDYLVRMDAVSGKFQPELATSWQLIEPTVWEFKLREGVKFHNGDPFTAADVKFTVERVATNKDLTENRTMNVVKEVQVVDPHTVRIITHQPDPALLNRLSRIGSGIMPQQYWESVGGVDGWQKAPVGTGPFKFQQWVKDDRVTLVAFDDHWRGRARVDEVVIRILPEVATRVAELQAGGVDIALNIGVDNADMIQSDPNLAVAKGLNNRVWLLLARTQPESATGDPRVREAIELAIDKEALIAAASPGLGAPLRTRVTPGIFGHDPSLYNVNPVNQARARQLLADAGFAGGLEIGLLSRNASDYSVVAQTVAGMLEQVGIKVNLEIVDTSVYNNKLSAGSNPELYLAAFGNSMKDAELAFTFITESAYHKRIGYKPDDALALFEQSRSEMDPEKRANLFRQLQQKVAADRPQIMLFQMGSVHGVRKGIQWQVPPDEMMWIYDMQVSG